MTDVSVFSDPQFLHHCPHRHGKSDAGRSSVARKPARVRRGHAAQFSTTWNWSANGEITIKLQAAAWSSRRPMAENYILNLHRTRRPCGFSFEVSRSLKACDGGAAGGGLPEGVEAQDGFRERVSGAGERSGDSFRCQQDSTLPAHRSSPDQRENRSRSSASTPVTPIRLFRQDRLGVAAILQAVVDSGAPPAGSAL